LNLIRGKFCTAQSLYKDKKEEKIDRQIQGIIKQSKMRRPEKQEEESRTKKGKPLLNNV
jgi:hypothetical protein